MIFRASLLFSSLVALCACDTSANPADTSQSTCEVTAGSHDGACQEGACTISEDVILQCGELDSFGDFALAPSFDEVWLASSKEGAPVVVRVADGAATTPTGGLTSGVNARLAVDGSGRPHFVSAVLESGAYATQYAVLQDGGWQATTLPSWGPLNLEIDRNDQPIVWATGPEYEGTDVYTGSSFDRVNVEDFGGAARFSLGADGAASRFLTDDDASQIVAATNGETLSLYQAGILAPDEFGIAAPPAPWPTEDIGPRLAVLVDDGELENGEWIGGLYVAFADDATTEPIPLPESHLPNDDCPDYNDFDDEFAMCDQLGACSSDSVGVFQLDWAIARTNDGLLWAAMIQAHVQTSGVYAEACYDDEFCECAVEVTTDDTTHELQLFRVDPSTRDVTLALRLPVGELAFQGLVMRGYGTSLAIGLGTEDDATLRVLRVETAP